MKRLVFDLSMPGGTVTVEADALSGHPHCVLRADGSEMSPSMFGRALTHMSGLRARYLDALKEAAARKAKP